MHSLSWYSGSVVVRASRIFAMFESDASPLRTAARGDLSASWMDHLVCNSSVTVSRYALRHSDSSCFELDQTVEVEMSPCVLGNLG